MEDDSDDEWDIESDDELDARLGLTKPKEEEEIDLTIIENEKAAKEQKTVLKAKGNALAEKKRLEEKRKEEEEIARKVMELELERENNMTSDERILLQREREAEFAGEQIDDLFGEVDDRRPVTVKKSVDSEIVLKDLKDHLKYARKVSQAMKNHGKIHLTAAFLKECIQGCKDCLDDDAVTDLIKSLNVIKNEKVIAAKKKVKGQAQKTKKDKAAEARAKKVCDETFGDNDIYDRYDEYADQYEDDFF